MIGALIAFLVGCLVLCVVVYIAHLVIGMLALPDPIGRIAVLVIGLIGLLILIALVWQLAGGAGGFHVP